MNFQGFTDFQPLKSSSSRSAAHGGRLFPTRADYERTYRTSTGRLTDPWADPEFAAAVMRDWHGTGQTGCLFARRLSDVASHSAWPAVVFLGGDPVDLSRQVRDLAEPALHEAIVRPDCELVSFLFPGVSTVLGLREVCDLLVANTGITLSEDRSNAGVSLVTLRLGISGEDTLSWVMGFGPFVNWPATRQAPVLEFAIRVKPKPESLFHKLNQDSTAAHLADSDPRLTESQMEKVFDRTERTTRDVLGAAPDFRSAAKVTFSFPSRLWDAALPG